MIDTDEFVQRDIDPDIRLNECPFCGEREMFHVYSVGWEHPGRAVQCAMCGSFGPKENTKLEAQMEWNRRYMAPESQERGGIDE